jgi:hypothetical protein
MDTKKKLSNKGENTTKNISLKIHVKTVAECIIVVPSELTLMYNAKNFSH